MYNNDKFSNLEQRVSYIKDKTKGKRRMSIAEKDELKGRIGAISEMLTDILNNNEIELDIKNQLARETRNQIVLINKVLDNLEKAITVVRENIE